MDFKNTQLQYFFESYFYIIAVLANLSQTPFKTKKNKNPKKQYLRKIKYPK